jgi:phosphatidate cytidylyltransferase
MTTQQRLFGYEHAFDDPVVTALTCVIAGVLLLASVVIALLAATGKLQPELRKELVRRTAAWAVMGPAVIVPILLGAAWTIALVFILSLLCYREFARATGFFREKVMSLMVVVGIGLVTLATLDHWYGLFVALAPLVAIVMASVALAADRPKGYIQRIGLAFLAFLLFGVCLGHLGYFANDPQYRSLLMLLLTTTAMNDVFAFVVGKSIGGPKLAPATSPNKTIAGSLGALVLTTGLFAVLGSFVFGGTALASWHHLLLMGATVSVAGQLGDLMISSCKRDLGIKDMGMMIPGHGGVLDRCNSLLLVSPALFHYIGYFRGIGLGQPTRILIGHG